MDDSQIQSVKRAYIYPTLNCNLPCPHCYTLRPSFAPEFNHKRVESADIFEVVAKLKAMGVHHFDISGGEPLLYPKIVELCQTIKQTKDAKITLVSNATLFRKRYATVASLANLADHWVVSFESGNPNVHNKIRGERSFQRAVDGLRVLSELEIERVALNTVLFPEHDCREILSVLEIGKTHRATAVHFMQLKWDHRWNPEYLEFLDSCLQKLSEFATDGLQIRFDVPAIFLRTLKQRWQAKLGRNVRIQSLELRGSQSFNGEVIVAADGSVTGNVDMLYRDEFAAGNLRTHPVEDVMAKMSRFRKRILERKQFLKDGHCAGCEYWLECGGGSPEMATSLADWDRQPDRRCPRQKD